MVRTVLTSTLATLAGALAVAACGGGDTSATGGAGGATASTSSSTGSTSITTSSTVPTTTSSTLSTGTGGTTFCSGGIDITFGDYLSGDLATTGQQDLYRFSGKQGQVVMIDIDAQYFDNAAFDPDHIDPVLTLFDADGKQLAQNNDPIEFSTGDSRLYTILPADGEYCVRVSDCWTTITNPAQSCTSPKDKLFTAYSVYLGEIVDDAGDANTAEVEAGDDATSATTIDYAVDDNGYYTMTFWGTFRDEVDVDVWSFTLPSDPTLEPPADARTTASFYLMPSGTTGSGSTSATSMVTIADASAPSAIIASVNAVKNPRLIPRLDLGTPYLLYVTRPQGTPAANDFYFVRHYIGWGNTLELEGLGTGMNDTPATAEPTAVDTLDGYFEGDLTNAAADVDHFLAPVPFGATSVGISCAAQRYGSGLRGFKVSLLKADGTPLAAGASDTESETAWAYFSGISVGTETNVIAKVEAASQDPLVSSSFYLCGIHFQQ